MEILYPFFFFIFIGFVFRVADGVCKKSFLEILLTAYFTFTGSVISAGLILQYLHLDDDRRVWSWAVFIPAFVLYIQFSRLFSERQDSKTLFQITGNRIQFAFEWYRALPPFATIGIGALIIAWIFFSWLHLGYNPIQSEHFPSESQKALQTYCYLMSGKRASFNNLPDNLAYWITGFALLGIGQRLFKSFTIGLYMALAGWSLQIISSEFFVIDGLFISLTACLVFFSLNYKQSLRRRYLYLAGLTGAMAFGHDDIFGILLPIILPLISYTVFWDKEVSSIFIDRFKHLAFGTIIGILLFVPHYFEPSFFLYFGGFLLSLFTLYLLASTALHLSDGSISEFLLIFFAVWVATLIPAGYMLSEFSVINQFHFWAITTCFIALLYQRMTVWFGYRNVQFQELRLSEWFGKLEKYEQVMFMLMMFTVLICNLVNLALVLYTVPNEWDSMTGHLMKVGYYLQNGNMNWVEGTNWSIDFYPRSLPSIQIYNYLWFGKNELGLKNIHYLSYWVGALAVYGIVKRIFNNITAAIFCALVFAILPIVLVQATTTETDLVMTAYLGLMVYFFFSFYDTKEKKYLVLASLMIAIGLSHKITLLLILPALAIIGLYILWGKGFWKNVLVTKVAFILCFAIFVLPTGYIKNYQVFGSLTAPKSVMDYHGIGKYSTKEIVLEGSKNVLRYGFDFFNLDGLRNINRGEVLNDKLRSGAVRIGKKFNLEDDKFWVITPFHFTKVYPFHFERPYWGIISFALIFPIILLIFFRRIKNKTLLVLAAACVIHFLALSFTAPYDPIKGRYFMNMAIFAIPVLGIMFGNPLKNSLLLRNYLTLIILVACVSAVFTVSLRLISPIFKFRYGKSIFEMSRMEQMTLARPEITEAYLKFNELVPDTATVALATQNEDFEYPLFGKKFSRKLIPIHPFREKVKPIPTEADYLFFTAGVLPVQKGDIRLDKTQEEQKTEVKMPESVYYLRKLK